MFCEALLLVAVVAAIIVLGLLIYARWNYGELEKLGIPVVKPHFLLGSSPDYYKIVNHLQDYEWFKKHGEVHGVYFGRFCHVHVSDPDIIRQIYVKDFDKFSSRDFHFPLDPNNPVSEIMDFLSGEKWKIVRSYLSPIFTTAKIKKMGDHIIGVGNDYVDRLKADILASPDRKLKDFDLKNELFVAFTDMVARCTLNIKIDNPRDPNNDFAKALLHLFSSKPPGYLTPYLPSFPWLTKLFTPSFAKDTDFFSHVFRKVMAERKKSGSTKGGDKDFIDLLNDMDDKVQTDPEWKRLGITNQTVIAQGLVFFIAGQDPMSMSITMIAYYLEKYPAVREKLYAEVDDYVAKYNGEIRHETLGELVYLNACIQEALRLNPSFTRVERHCNADWEYKGFKVKKGMTVLIPAWACNRNPRAYSDPEEFKPERFLPSNRSKLDPYAYASFGQGPRTCIGMRFALECTLVMALRTFQHFKFSYKPGLEPSFYPGIAEMAFMMPLNMDVELREPLQK